MQFEIMEGVYMEALEENFHAIKKGGSFFT
jgi:hypothetical protein